MQLNEMIGFGIAGNFAGHLEQAGEAADFVNVKVKDANQPKAIFPFYVPKLPDSFLSVFPISSDKIIFPVGGDNLQIEPEVVLLCDLVYEGERVKALRPREFAAFNDCSIRRPGARKISEKKNWGSASKGMAPQRFAIDHFGAGGVLDHYRIASFMLRNGQCHAYGQDSGVVDYSYFHEKLLDWAVETLNQQQDDGPAENIAALLKAAAYPRQALLSIGATRYTPFGEQTFLMPGDESVVVVYDGRRYDAAQIRALVETGGEPGPNISLVRQRVVSE